MSRGEQAAWAAFLLLVALIGYRRFDSTDTAVHILAGREILATRAIPSTDPFSFTVPGAPWFVNQWIPEIVFAVVERAAGIDGLIWLRVALLIATFAALAWALRRHARAPFGAAIGALLLVLYASHRLFVLRPLLFTALFLALLVVILESYRRGGRDRLLLMPFLFVVWVNCHAGYVFGGILTLLVLAAESVKWVAAGRLGEPLPGRRIGRLAAMFGVSLAASFLVASLVNPRGFATVLLPFALLDNTFFLNIIGEYQRANQIDVVFWICVALLVLSFAWRLARRGIRAVDLTDCFVTLPFAFQAWRTHRVILFFAIVAAPALARALAAACDDLAALRPRSRVRAGSGGGWPAAARSIGPWLAAGLVLALAGWRVARDPFLGTGLSPILYPRDAGIRFLSEGRIHGNIFHNDAWAGAVALFGWPRYKLFIDGRLEVYGEPFWRDVYFRVLGCGDGWEALLARLGVNAALVRVGSPGKRDRIGSVLRTHPDWALVYWDELAMLFVRRIPEHAALIARHEVPPEVDPEDLRLPPPGAGRARFLAAMDRALAEDPGSIPALYGAVTACVETGGAVISDPARYLPLVRARMKERVARRDWRLAWLEGRVLLAQGDAAGAVRALDRAEGLGGAGWPDLVIDKLAALARAGRNGEAARVREREAQRIEMSSEGARAAALFSYRAGKALAAAGERDAARAAYADAARLDGANPNYAVAHAWSLVVDSRFDEAVRASGAGLARFAGDPYLLGTRGWALFRLGRAAEAERDLRAALDALPPEDRAARAAEAAHLGEVLLERGAGAEARVFLLRALDEPAAAGLAEVQRAGALLDSLGER